jgi:uncharacterized protein
MWANLANIVLKNRWLFLIVVLVTSGFMAYQASQVKLNYEFSRSIPTDNAKYIAYQKFKQQFGQDGNLLVVAVQDSQFFNINHYNAYKKLIATITAVPKVENVLAVPSTFNLVNDALTEKISAQKIFTDTINSQEQLNTASAEFLNLPFYNGMLYNPKSHVYLMGVKINDSVLLTKQRTAVINNINAAIANYENSTKLKTHVSGLPLIRTVVGDKIQKEMGIFLIASVLLSAIILLLFFRSFSTTILSLSIVLLGVTWSLGIMQLFGFKITLLSALIPSLVVVIGVPNCIYFLNKYHTNYLQNGNQQKSLVDMVSKMGVVTLFCNITAAIGFGVFSFTSSAILKEFGIVACIAIMVIFLLSFIILPAVLSLLAPPNTTQTKYLNSKLINVSIAKLQSWAIHQQKAIGIVTMLVLAIAVLGILRLKSNAYIVDDLPKTDKVYTDLKFFEQHFKGIMPLEIIVDTKKPNGLRKSGVFEKVDSLDQFIANQPVMARPLSLAEAMKFIYQGVSGGDSAAYFFPNAAIVNSTLQEVKKQVRQNGNDSTVGADNKATKTFTAYVDSTMQYTRISVNMADVGTAALPSILNGVEARSSQLFDTTQFNVTLTGSSITFLEGSQYIINGLKESILWAFALIALCMLYLFKNLRILLISVLPNIIPLLLTAGVMGWAGIPLKPSTVLVFSVALGIAIDITIRFLVNYKQELPATNNVQTTVLSTIKNTGLSIIYTSLVLIAGFIIFCLSEFGGTFALGWLTSFTLVVATVTNLTLLPILLLKLAPKPTATVNKKAELFL